MKQPYLFMLYFILYGWYKRKYLIGEEVIAKPESNVVGNFRTVNAAVKGITKDGKETMQRFIILVK